MQQKKFPATSILAYGLTGFLGAWFVAALLVFGIHKPSVPTAPVDAVIILGGSSAERLPVAQSLAADLQSPLLVVSRTDSAGNASADQLCREGSQDSSLLCFTPLGMNTRSEAAVIGELVQAHGWDSVAVVTSSYHVPRAGTLIRQCTAAQVAMVASEPELDSLGWLRRFVIETGGLLDVTLSPECQEKRGAASSGG